MKKVIVIIFIIFASFLTFSLYRTFAYDTSIVEETPSTTDLEYTFKIGNSSIKQITIDSGETKYYDVVLGNPNPAKISYGVYYEMVSPSSKPDGFSIEYTSKSTGDSTGKVDKEGNITLNLVVTNTSSSSVTVKLGSVAGYVNGGDLELSSNQEFIPVFSASRYIESLASVSDSGVSKFHHNAISAENSATGKEIKAVDDYRYGGRSDKNYICLNLNEDGNCDDNDLYRIIGSIYEENSNKNLIKVIKNKYIKDDNGEPPCWDYKVENGIASSSNVWSTKTSGTDSGSTLMQMLNSIWLNSGIGKYYNGSTVETIIDFSNSGIDDKARRLINTNSRYYLGGFDDATISTDEMYLAERGVNTSNGNANYWDGTIALIYPSDSGYMWYGCSGIKCKSNYFPIAELFTITPVTNTVSFVYYKTPIENLGLTNNINSIAYFFPVFYLKPDVYITGGTGTSTNPYQIDLPK